MTAGILALAVVLASPGVRARPAIQLSPENADRARHGLLPRKAFRARTPARGRRIVLLPRAPTWLGEPGGVADPIVEPAVDGDDALAAGDAVVPVAMNDAPAGAAEPVPGPWAAARGVAVDAVVVRSLAGAPAISAAASGTEVEAVIVHRRGAAGR